MNYSPDNSINLTQSSNHDTLLLTWPYREKRRLPSSLTLMVFSPCSEIMPHINSESTSSPLQKCTPSNRNSRGVVCIITESRPKINSMSWGRMDTYSGMLRSTNSKTPCENVKSGLENVRKTARLSNWKSVWSGAGNEWNTDRLFYSTSNFRHFLLVNRLQYDCSAFMYFCRSLLKLGTFLARSLIVVIVWLGKLLIRCWTISRNDWKCKEWTRGPVYWVSVGRSISNTWFVVVSLSKSWGISLL